MKKQQQKQRLNRLRRKKRRKQQDEKQNRISKKLKTTTNPLATTENLSIHSLDYTTYEYLMDFSTHFVWLCVEVVGSSFFVDG